MSTLKLPLIKNGIGFLGGAGIGMSALAKLCHHLKYSVYLTDKNVEAVKSVSEKIGCDWDDELNFDHTCIDLSVFSNAVKKENFLYKRLIENGISVVPRSHFLADILNLNKSIAVTGSHGKTTVTLMISHILDELGREPWVIAGGIDQQYNDNFRPGKTSWVVAELDESDGLFVRAKPDILVITNLELEHVNLYKSLKQKLDVFSRYLTSLTSENLLIYNGDETILKQVISDSSINCETISCGFSKQNDYVFKVLSLNKVSVYNSTNRETYEVCSSLIGTHNLFNLGLSFVTATLNRDIMSSSFDFSNQIIGVRRRMEFLGLCAGGARIYSDYGHHPTEINATLKSFNQKYPDKEIVAIFEGHRLSRVHHFNNEFAKALNLADKVFLAPIYLAGESGDMRTHLESLKNTCISTKSNIVSYDELREYILRESTDTQVIIFFSAGSLDLMVRKWLELPL